MKYSALFLVCFASLVGSAVPAALPEAAAPKTPTAIPPANVRGGKISDFLSSLLPTAWQKRPEVRFNVYTEMTPVGRAWRLPTREKPMYYYSPPGQMVETGEIYGGEKPPPKATLEEAMRKALEANGYFPISDEHPRPDLLIIFAFGSNGGVAEDGIVSANDVVRSVIRSPYLFKDVIDRARFVAGDKFAYDLYTALKDEAVFGGSADNPPFQVFMHSYDSDVVDHFVEIAFHSYYFATATAYDFTGVEQKRKVPLWQTRMAVEAQGVSMEEIMRPLIANTGPSLGRETPTPLWVTKRVDRDGHIEMSAPTVIEEPRPVAPAPTGASTPAKSPP